jgi:nucleoside-diphosphate-sugar epimerase
MPRVLIAGCGYLGQAVADLLVADGWEVEGWTQSAESAAKISGKSYSVRAVDISQEKQVLVQTGDFDAVIHCASTRGGNVDLYRRVYFDGARNLLHRFGASRILLTSSTSVYGQKDGDWVFEESLAEPKHETGKILRKAEVFVRASGANVVRLGGIYGPGRSALLKNVLDGDAIIDPSHDRFLNQIHRDDAATAIQLLLKQPRPAGEIYNVVDNEPILLSECYRWLATKLDRRVRVAGRSLARSASKRKRGDSNKRVSNAKLRAIGWTPRYPNFTEGMEKSLLLTFDHEGA